MKKIQYTLIIFALLTMFSCSSDDGDTTPSGTITGHVKHHDDAIPNAIVYIKYNATEFPGSNPNDYDDQTTASAGDAHYTFSGLGKGSYYLYGVGTDAGCSCEVVGGIPITLDSDNQEVESNIPVTE